MEDKRHSFNSKEPELFRFEEWPVYKAGLRVCKLAYEFRTKAPKTERSGIFDQFKRAAVSITLNLAEGYSRFSKKEKIAFLRISLGSTFECSAIVDILREVDLIGAADHQKAKEALRNIAKMINGLIRYIDNNLR